MEASSKTVPSIVVYVTVPNKEAGKWGYCCFAVLVFYPYVCDIMYLLNS